VAAEYAIDTPCPMGSGQSLTVTPSSPPASPIASLSGTIAAATVAALSEGTHTVSVDSKDAAGNWGACATSTLTVDKTGPTTANLGVSPNPNNGTLSIDPNKLEIWVTGTVTDPIASGVQSNIKAVEGFLDTAGANGSGIVAIPVDGSFNSPTESFYLPMPLYSVRALTQGPHTFYMHGQDTAGNWGPLSTVILIVDKTGPTITGASAAPNPTNGAGSVTLNAAATDSANGTAAASNIVAAEWFRGIDPGAGNGTPMSAATGAFSSSATLALTATINVSTWSYGNYTLSVRAKDAAGNWGPVVTTPLNVLPSDALFADSFESGNFNAWTAQTGAGITVTTAAALGKDGGKLGMQAVISGTATSYVTDGTPNNVTSYHARFYFNPNGTSTNTTSHEIFVGRNKPGTMIFRIQYRRNGTGTFTYQVRAGALQQNGTGTATTFTPWVTITNAAHAIELAWQAGASGSLSLYVDGGPAKQTLTGLATGDATYQLKTVRLGPSNGLATGMAGTEYYDAFVSTTSTQIGP
jgi:hypothetical protein